MAGNARSAILGPGYFGPAHVDSDIVAGATNLQKYIASFKHSLLFNPKLLLTDEMLLTENFRAAYLTDSEFQKLFRDDLISVAHNDRIYGGRALTLIESRRFHKWLKEGQPDRFHPLHGSDLSDEFDEHLEAIQSGVERLYPDASKRDPNYTAYLDILFENEICRNIFGPQYGLIDVAYLELREKIKKEGHVLGVIHIDESHRLDGTENSLDVMGKESTLLGIPRQELVTKYSKILSQISRTLMVKAELRVLSDAHAILPTDLKPVRALAFSELDEQSIDEREANIRSEKLDLQAISLHSMSTLTLDEILEMRKAAKPFFDSIRQDHDKPEAFDHIWQEAKKYCRYLNYKLGFREKATTSSRINSRIRLVQGKLNKHKGFVHGGLAMCFQVAASLSSTFSTVALGSADAGAAAKLPLENAEEMIKQALAPANLENIVQDVKSTLIIAGVNDRQCMLSYD